MSDRIRGARRGLRSALALVAIAFGGACSNQPFTEPSPGVDVRVNFLQPHGIAVAPDSVIVVSELRGRYLALRGDTVVVRLTRLTGTPHPIEWAGHEVSFTHDRMTRIEQTSFDRSMPSTIALVGMTWMLCWLFSESDY